jgi:hypothetical protein
MTAPSRSSVPSGGDLPQLVPLSPSAAPDNPRVCMFPVTQTTPHDIVLPKPVPITSPSPTQHSHSMTQLSSPTTSYSTRAPTSLFSATRRGSAPRPTRRHDQRAPTAHSTDILNDMAMSNCIPPLSPLLGGRTLLEADESELLAQDAAAWYQDAAAWYRTGVGKIGYLLQTKPDLCFAYRTGVGKIGYLLQTKPDLCFAFSQPQQAPHQARQNVTSRHSSTSSAACPSTARRASRSSATSSRCELQPTQTATTPPTSTFARRSCSARHVRRRALPRQQRPSSPRSSRRALPYLRYAISTSRWVSSPTGHRGSTATRRPQLPPSWAASGSSSVALQNTTLYALQAPRATRRRCRSGLAGRLRYLPSRQPSAQVTPGAAARAISSRGAGVHRRVPV